MKKTPSLRKSEEEETFLARLFFFWVQPVLTRGFQRNKSQG